MRRSKKPYEIRSGRTVIQLVTGAIAILLLNLCSCATWQMPADRDDAALRARAISDTVKGVTLSASVLSAADSKQLFGGDINVDGIQPVWIQVRNESSHTLWLLRSGTDPNYFSPLEVAWPLHTKFAKRSNARIDDYFDSLSFQNPIPPGTTKSGILFTNYHMNTHVLNVDLLGQQSIFPFTLFLPVPGEYSQKLYETIVRYIDAAAVNYQDSDAFRDALEKLPCCAPGGDPVNMVAVAKLDDLAAAIIRRGYRVQKEDADSRQQLFGRSPDIVLRKIGTGAPAYRIRMWVAPFRYQGIPVFVAQSGRPVGGRFSDASDGGRPLHPNVDETRNLIIQDLLYSGGLAQLGFVGGVGHVPEARAEKDGSDTLYYTDGLRAVLFFVTRPLTLSDIEILDWVPLLQQRESEAAVNNTE